MNKDDILAKSRAENLGKTDEYEKMVLEKAGRSAAQVGMVVCCIIAAASIAVTNQMNSGCWVIYFSIYASLFWVKYLHLKKRHELMLAIVATAVGLLFAVYFVLDLVRYVHG